MTIGSNRNLTNSGSDSHEEFADEPSAQPRQQLRGDLTTSIINVDEVPPTEQAIQGGGGLKKRESRESTNSKGDMSLSDHIAADAVAATETIRNVLNDNVLNPYGDDDQEESVEDQSTMEEALTEDIYSLMCVAPVCSASFLFAFIVFAMQFSLIILVLLDLVDDSEDPVTTNGEVNWMFIPVDAPMEVTAAQFIGVILIVNFVSGQGDLLVGFAHLLNGYSESILENNPHATRMKWYFAGSCQLLVGMFLVVDLFILMMQSTSNIILCLNFAALHFVQDIDDVAFSMAAMGLVTRRVQKDCNQVGEVMIPSFESRRNNWIKRGFLIALTTALYTCYFIIVGWQWNGHFMCHSLYVQFGDVWFSELPYYSGVFKAETLEYQNRIDGRAVYIDSTRTIRLAYCSAQQAWAFSNITATDNHCDYFILSTSSWGYDIMDIADKTWYALNIDLGHVPMDWLAVDCNDCDDAKCPPEAGKCVNNKCICNGDDRIGLRCEFLEDNDHLCKYMALDRRSKADVSAMSFASLFTRREYQRFETAAVETMYNRPIYISLHPLTKKIDIFIVFSGYRWIIYGVPQEKTSNLTTTQFGNYLAANDPHVNPLQTLMNISGDALPYFVPFFFSSPFKFETKSHDVDPVNAHWLLAQTDESLPIVGAYPDIDHSVSANFICAYCNNDTNPCLHNGVCIDNKCDCNTTGIQSYGGSLCEYAFSCSEFNAREGLENGLNGCHCDPVFDICIRCENELYYGNLCQYKREEAIVEETEVVYLDGRDECKNETCRNGGFCVSNVQACECPENFRGIYCEDYVPFETLAPGCHNSTCLHDGYCAPDATTDSCTCVEPYTGKKCEILHPIIVFGNATNETSTNETEEISINGVDLVDDDGLLDVDLEEFAVITDVPAATIEPSKSTISAYSGSTFDQYQGTSFESTRGEDMPTAEGRRYEYRASATVHESMRNGATTTADEDRAMSTESGKTLCSPMDCYWRKCECETRV